MLLLNRLIKYSGMAGFAALALTFYTGITEGNFLVHKYSAITGITFMCMHGGLVLYRGWKIKQQTRARLAASPAPEEERK